MKKVFALIVLTALCAVMILPALVHGQNNVVTAQALAGGRASDQTSQAAQRPDKADGRYFVVFRNGVNAANTNAVKAAGGTVRHTFSDLRAQAIEIHNQHQLEALQRNPNVEYVEQESQHYAMDLSSSQLTPTATNGLYGLVTTKSTDVHSRGVTGGGMIVGVVDTGIDCNHPDIAGRLLGGYNAVSGQSTANYCWQGDPLEDHGTHVAGTILGAYNTQGVYGVAYQAQLYHARALKGNAATGTASGSSSDIMAAVRWLVETKGVNIVNMSLGGGARSQTEQNFYKKEHDTYGALIICATGNDGATTVSYPAAYPTNIAVGAVDKNNLVATFSNRGTNIDVVAPGVGVLSSVPVGQGSEASVTTNTERTAFGMTFAAKTNGISGLMFDCGIGNPGQCPAGVAGNIALIQRGTLSFAEKVQNAMNQGAVAAILYNNAAGDFLGTLGAATTTDGRAWIPAVTVSDATGATLKTQLTTTTTVLNKVSNWDYYDGTSMATPHVAGVVALIWSANPSLTNVTVESYLKTTCTDLGAAGYDTTYGYGIVNASAAVAKAGR
jgi:subtilisin family serine protease